MVKEQTKARYSGQCATGAEKDGERCWNRWMGSMGMPINRRYMQNILFWPCDGFGTSLRGFNFYGHSAWKRHECQHYKQGDLLAHTHDTYEFDIGFRPDSCPSPWQSYLHVEVGLSKPSGIAANHPSAASFLQEFAAQFRGQFPVTHQYIDSKRDAYLYVLLPLLADVNKVGIAKEVKLQGSVFTTRITQTWRLMYEGPKLGKRQQILRDVP
jgi:hypothetical protein